jgi:hypothetical protein
MDRVRTFRQEIAHHVTNQAEAMKNKAKTGGAAERLSLFFRPRVRAVSCRISRQYTTTRS